MRMTRLKAAAVATLLAGGLAACGGGDDEGGEVAVNEDAQFESGTTMARIQEAGELRVGTKFDQPGFGLQGLEDVPEGFDVEVAKIIGGALGLSEDQITFSQAPSEVREQVIEDGDVDMVVATYTINDERKQRISFAGPYYVAGQTLMTRAGDDTISGPEDLADNPDYQVCSVNGSTPSENIREYLASPDQLTLFDVYERCAEALETEQVDVVTTDNVILLGLVSTSDGAFQLVGDTFTDEPYGIGIEKGDVEFCEFINQTLQDNEEAYVDAWERTAGQVEGTETPELPEPDECS